MRTISIATTAVAGMITTGLLALPVSTAFAQDDQAMKRNEDTPDVVLVADEDDDDTNAQGRDTASNTGGTGAGTNTDTNSRDHTNSRKTAVSRDRDWSNADKTRDKTRDGKGGKKRDWSQNRTNDRSRNDSR